MRYVSTRGTAPTLDFADTLLTGLAVDGGLYMPETWPALTEVPRGTPYARAATEIIWPFVEGSLERSELAELVEDAYRTFRHPAVVPLVQVGDDDWMAELFHGPTLAFKDVALQLVGRLFDHELARRGERVVIVGATSGDTGSAAIEACRDRENIEVFILHPADRVSDVQRRQMTTVDAPNIHNFAVEGTFDDCQDLVKAMFADVSFREANHLAAVNSINWARVMAQIVYYVTTARSLGASPAQPVSFCVPTGNFGNILAAWAARAMGAPIGRLLIASNANDILFRTVEQGVMSVQPVVPTLSPSMDIQISSNFERLLFELNGRDGGLTAEQLLQFRATGSLRFEDDQLEQLRATFRAGTLDDRDTMAEIARTYRATGLLVDPHTAVGLGVARRLREGLEGPCITMATAHAAKFPDAVEAATGVRPPLPAFLGDLLTRPERYERVPNDLAAIQRRITELVR